MLFITSIVFGKVIFNLPLIKSLHCMLTQSLIGIHADWLMIFKIVLISQNNTACPLHFWSWVILKFASKLVYLGVEKHINVTFKLIHQKPGYEDYKFILFGTCTDGTYETFRKHLGNSPDLISIKEEKSGLSLLYWGQFQEG